MICVVYSRIGRHGLSGQGLGQVQLGPTFPSAPGGHCAPDRKREGDGKLKEATIDSSEDARTRYMFLRL